MLRVLLIIQVVTLTISLFGGGAAIWTLESRAGDLQRIAHRSAYQRCILIVGILNSFHTPQGRTNARLILLENPALNNCHTYATRNS